ncbi:sensor histidine kinase [Clostridium sp. DL1XJH146]
MFKKLRFRLLFMNLSIIIILMLTSFSSIYIITYNNIHNTINEDLNRISDVKKEFNIGQEVNPLYSAKDNINMTSDLDEKDRELPEKLVSFVIETDMEGNILKVVSSFEAEDSFYEEALTLVQENSYIGNNFTLDSNEWAYKIKETGFGNLYFYLDITSQQNVLDKLVITFIIVSIIMIFFIFLISNFLTNRSIKPIKEAFEKQKQFISDASHELKTPLAVIRTNVDVLISNQPSKDTLDSKWLSYIKSEVDRMGNLTKDLLYLTQMESGEERELLKYSFNLSEKIEQQLLGMEALAFEKNIEMDYEIAQNINIVGNTEQLIQVVMILLDNAFKYTPEKGKINLSLVRTNHHVVFSVTNTGGGIDPKEVNRIFERFYRVDKARSRVNGSHGLGLSIAKAIVEQHNGKIYCESILNEKTTFTVKLKI